VSRKHSHERFIGRDYQRPKRYRLPVTIHHVAYRIRQPDVRRAKLVGVRKILLDMKLPASSCPEIIERSGKAFASKVIR
jgi:hypothetical protein